MTDVYAQLEEMMGQQFVFPWSSKEAIQAIMAGENPAPRGENFYYFYLKLNVDGI